MKYISKLFPASLRNYLSPRRKAEYGLILRHRRPGYHLLKGAGLEIGALHLPAPLPRACKTIYADTITTKEATATFPELGSYDLVPVSLIVDLNKSGLANVADAEYDYLVLNHVIEHVANPIRTVNEVFRVVRTGGCVVVSAPDKDFTFDRPRALTSFAHLQEEYDNNVSEVSDEHYRDFVLATNEDLKSANPDKLASEVGEARRRREHAHVWDSDSFADFMTQSLAMLGIQAQLAFVSTGRENKFEYFSVWRKQ